MPHDLRTPSRSMSASGRFASPLPVRLRFRVIAGMCAVTGECCLIRSLVDRLLGKEQALGSIPKLGSKRNAFVVQWQNFSLVMRIRGFDSCQRLYQKWCTNFGGGSSEWVGWDITPTTECESRVKDSPDAVIGNKQTPDGVTKPSQVSAERTNRLVLHCRCCWRGLAPVSYSGFCQFDSDQRLSHPANPRHGQPESKESNGKVSTNSERRSSYPT